MADNGKSFGSTEVSLKSLTKYINKDIAPTGNTDFSLRTFTTGYNKKGTKILGWGDLNKWSRIKPVISESESYDYPEPKGTLLNRMRNANYGLTSPGEYTSWASAYYEETGFEYQMPSDTGNNTFRLGDYRYYLHSVTVRDGTETWSPIKNFSIKFNGTAANPLDYQNLEDGQNWCNFNLPLPPADRIDGEIVTLLISMDDLAETIYGSTTPVPNKTWDPSWGREFKYYYAVIAIRRSDSYSCILYSDKPITEYNYLEHPDEINVYTPTYDSKFEDYGEEFAKEGTWDFHPLAVAKYTKDEVLVETLAKAEDRGVKFKKLPITTSCTYYLTNTMADKKLTMEVTNVSMSIETGFSSVSMRCRLNTPIDNSALTVNITGMGVYQTSTSTEDFSYDFFTSRTLTIAQGEYVSNTITVYKDEFDNPKPALAEGNVVKTQHDPPIYYIIPPGKTEEEREPRTISNIEYSNYEIPSYIINNNEVIIIKGE